MDIRKDLLLKSAERLYTLGVDIEAARDKLRNLVDRGVPYDAQEMKDALQEFTELDTQWKELEKRHIKLRDEIVAGRDKAASDD